MASTKLPKKSTAPGKGHGIRTPAPKLPPIKGPGAPGKSLPATRRGAKK